MVQGQQDGSILRTLTLMDRQAVSQCYVLDSILVESDQAIAGKLNIEVVPVVILADALDFADITVANINGDIDV